MIWGHEKLDGLVEKLRGPVLVYGEAGTGKTTLMLEALRRSRGRSVYIGTEGSAAYQPRVESLGGLDHVLFVEVDSLEEQTRLVLSLASLGPRTLSMLVVDSVNSLYRLEEDIQKAGMMLGLQMAVLRQLSRSGVVTLTTGQVHGEGDEASGTWLLEFWAPLIIRLKRAGAEREAEVVKPEEHTFKARFTITGWGVEWVS